MSTHERLYTEDGQPTEAWRCSKCLEVYKSEYLAENCCEPRFCDECGTQYAERVYICDPCWRAKSKRAAAKRWSKATPMPSAEYDGMVYVEDEDGDPVGGEDGWFSNHMGLLEWLEDEWRYEHPGEPDPELHVYAGTPKTLSFDADDLIDHGLEETYDGAGDEICTRAREELQAQLDTWTAAHSPTWWEIDYDRKFEDWNTAVSYE